MLPMQEIALISSLDLDQSTVHADSFFDSNHVTVGYTLYTEIFIFIFNVINMENVYFDPV